MWKLHTILVLGSLYCEFGNGSQLFQSSKGTADGYPLSFLQLRRSYSRPSDLVGLELSNAPNLLLEGDLIGVMPRRCARESPRDHCRQKMDMRACNCVWYLLRTGLSPQLRGKQPCEGFE
jgi:hypothetical protein